MDDIANRLKTLGQAVVEIKRIEGETKDSNFDWSLLFPEKKKLHILWLIFSILTYIAVCIGVILVGPKNQQDYLMAFTAGMIAVTWVASCAHLRFDRASLSAGIFFALFVAFLVAGRVLSPIEGANKILQHASMLGDSSKASVEAATAK